MRCHASLGGTLGKAPSARMWEVFQLAVVLVALGRMAEPLVMA